MRTLLVAFIGGIVGTVFTSMLVFAWTGPTAPPPAGNVAAPLNTGTTDQIKDGGLFLNALGIDGDAIQFGASRYLSFGTQPGADGYGIRDNSGTLQFKNSGGQWAAIASSTSSGGGGTSVDVQTFTSSGTWTRPANGTVTYIECWGGGGSGNRGNGGGHGGGGGAYNARLVAKAMLGATETVTIGAGGAGSAGNGNPGGTTSFGSWLTAYGGASGSAGGGGGGQLSAGNGQLAGEPRVPTDTPAGYGEGDGGTCYSPVHGVNGFWHGGGGGAPCGNGSGKGGASVYGGGGGGGVDWSTNPQPGGASSFGGAGSAAVVSGVSAPGAQPGGGSGGSGGTASGKGGDGKCVVTTW